MSFNLTSILVFAGYLALVNSAAYLAFYFDKKFAQNNRRRVAESTLLSFAFFGGATGAIIAQQKFRHKTRKQPFKTQLYAIAVLNLALLIALTIPSLRTELFQILASAI